MLFTSITFFLFFGIVFILSIFFRKDPKKYSVFLSIISLLFYAFFDPRFSGILAFAIIISYLLNTKSLENSKNAKKYFLSIIILSLATLGFFKYFNFFVESFSNLTNSEGLALVTDSLQIILPIGISFYIFKIISYAYDVYHSKVKHTDLWSYMAYVSFFPQLTAGPIMRPREFLVDLKAVNLYQLNINKTALMFLSGLGKKLVLSSLIFKFIQDIFILPANYSSLDLVIGVLAYAAYIYTDFSGYSDLANACSNMLGFSTVKNFDMPYKSSSPQEFWKRWHISLSEWLRDYLYIPLGGNRQGTIRKNINLLLTMVLGGLWHGAGLNFIFWGFIHGVGLVFSHSFMRGTSKSRFKFIYIILTQIFIGITWIYFAAPSLMQANDYIAGILKFDFSSLKFTDIRLFIAILFVYIINFRGNIISKKIIIFYQKLPFILKWIMFVTLLYIIFKIGPRETPPFVYFNF